MTKEEIQSYDRKWYHANKVRLREAKKESRQKFLAKCKAYILELKKQPCKDCGQCFPPCVMDFDHQRDKKFTIANQYWRGLEKLQEEVAKCDLVCANCHRIRTHIGK